MPISRSDPSSASRGCQAGMQTRPFTIQPNEGILPLPFASLRVICTQWRCRCRCSLGQGRCLLPAARRHWQHGTSHFALPHHHGTPGSAGSDGGGSCSRPACNPSLLCVTERTDGVHGVAQFIQLALLSSFSLSSASIHHHYALLLSPQPPQSSRNVTEFACRPPQVGVKRKTRRRTWHFMMRWRR